MSAPCAWPLPQRLRPLRRCWPWLLPAAPFPAFPPALRAAGAPTPAPALGAHPALPIPRGMADSFCSLTAFKARLQSSPLPCCSPWGGIPGCATSRGGRAMRSPPHPTPCFVGGSPASGVQRPTGPAVSLCFPCGACSPPLTLGRAKFHARDPHVDAGGCVVPLARRLCRGGCAAGEPVPGAAPNPSGAKPFLKQPAPILALDTVLAQDPLWAGSPRPVEPGPTVPGCGGRC